MAATVGFGEALRRHCGYVLGLAVAALALAMATHHPTIAPARPDPLAKLDSRMVAVKALIVAGDVPAAIIKLRATFRLDGTDGFGALRQFSMLVLERGLEDKDPFERYFAASALAKGGNYQGVYLLERGIRANPDLSLKMAAADGLADAGDAYAVGVLQKLYFAADPFDRRIVAEAMCDARDPASITVLSDAASGPDQSLRLAGLQGLGKLGNPAAAPLLRRIIASDAAPIERAMAAESLLKLGEPVDLNLVEGILNDTTKGSARPVAALALGYAHDPRVVTVLKLALADDDLDVRIGAATSLTHYMEPAGAAYLKQAMTDMDDTVTRQHVGQVMDQLSLAGGYDVLIAAVGATDPNLQMSGIRALGLDGGQKELEVLTALLPHTTDPLMRAQIAWSIGRIGQARGIETLIAMVQEEDPAVRYTASDALDITAQRLLAAASS
jgi:HEAT repeat protein